MRADDPELDLWFAWRRRRFLSIVGAVVAGIASIAVIGYLVLRSGDDDPTCELLPDGTTSDPSCLFVDASGIVGAVNPSGTNEPPLPELELTREAIEQSPDPRFLVVDALIDVVGARAPHEKLDYVQSLSPGLQMAWGTFVVDTEVRVGGFQQLFANPSSDFVEQARAGFELVGAVDHLRLLDEAVARAETILGPLQPYRERALDETTFQHFDELFDDLDAQYELLDLHPIVTAYIVEHPDEFATVESASSSPDGPPTVE